MRLIDDDLRAALRAEAVRHRPDREAMLDRITQTAMRNQQVRHRAAPRLRIGGAAVAVAAVLGGGGFAQWALAGDGAPPPPAPAPMVSVPMAPPASPSPSLAPSQPASATTGASSKPRRSRSSVPASPASPGSSASPRSSASPASPASSAPAGVPPGAEPATRGPIWSDGSIDADSSDSQGTGVVTIRTAERLTALNVTIRVARTPDLVSRGSSQQVPGASVNSAVTEEPDAITYRFALSSGDTLDPGTYLFRARYTHAEGGRDADGDSYAATAVTSGGATVAVTGAFG